MLKRAIKEVFGRPFTATAMLWKHRHTLGYLAGRYKWRQLYNFVFVTYFIRGEDCGKGVLDWLWKLCPDLAPFGWDIEVEVTTRCYGTCIHCEHTYWRDQIYLNQDLSFADFKKLIPMSAIIGANYLLLMDDIARTLTTGEIPIGILTSLVGTPFFAVLLWRNKVGWS